MLFLLSYNRFLPAAALYILASLTPRSVGLGLTHFALHPSSSPSGLGHDRVCLARTSGVYILKSLSWLVIRKYNCRKTKHSLNAN